MIRHVLVSAIELRSEGDDLIVSVNHKGRWHECFREHRDGPMNHCIHANGIAAAIEEEEDPS